MYEYIKAYICIYIYKYLKTNLISPKVEPEDMFICMYMNMYVCK
jgi:hypothetical protein